jgi:outer membrane protein assembly factor BamB
VFAYFGSYGLYCLDLDGELMWEKDFGRMHTLHGHGEGSSLALYDETLIVNWDHEGQSFAVALDKRTGTERWKVERDGVSSWTTPIIVEHGGEQQVIISGSKRVRGYDLATGTAIWECGGLSVENVVASPVAGEGIVYAASSYDKHTVLAIRLDGAIGDITGTKQVQWSRTGGTPYVPSPLLYGDSLYFLRHFQGILTRVNSMTGEDQPGPLRLNGIRTVFASPVAGGGRVYITDRDGTTVVISHDDTPELLALNPLDDNFSASAAIIGDELFLRGQKYLYCIAKEQGGAPEQSR